ncbi:hypothetical protein M407DRAFT_244724 [Tulasnella calospora MUT 4182]|uniref:Uncharacterized protein n=1 Tax=Tulasnella calospora MUT 4182 TaxID=1051891 RepID=A0A0C3QDF4_9AGAM|nr:hypothetical protein M407DRAFT_244724 [Tulasnella calospora MUT 4182]
MLHKTNRFFYETTPKPRQPTVASSQHRSGFVPCNKEPNTQPAGRQVASAPEIRRGRPSTNSTPRNYRGFSTNKVSESKASLAP